MTGERRHCGGAPVIQRFMRPGASSSLIVEHPAELLYMCRAEGTQSAMPRAMHRHDDRAEIVFIREGQGTHIIGGHEYRTRRGDVLIYNSGILHDESARPEVGIVAYCCGFRGLKLRGLPVNHLVPEQGSPVLASGEHHAAFEGLMQLLYDQVGQGGSAEVCHHLLQALIQLVGRLLERPELRLESPGYDLGQEVRRYIDERYAEAIDLQVMAQRFKVSPYHLAHRFKAAVGCSPIHYLIRRRVGEAQSLLINTPLSVAEIAEQVGYRHPSYFNTAFKRVVGVTPGGYRKRYLSG
ncbi:AraC family transcriptional regulator [Halomonas sp. EGI 63088]|uniref:AraC family transcriptional regulator n=1 Tax=Halomonas flagellata TaxID=2920385 RepID=A0ABS9RWM3_9GAMM|nr:AraC family transcriptional regulator [Halomonas flagellata]MCH4564253.1 AraC family transcriptional regulator [Halomonas flagellata]